MFIWETYETPRCLITWIIQTSYIDLCVQKTHCSLYFIWDGFGLIVLRSFWRLLFEAVKSADGSPGSQIKLENLHYSVLDVDQETIVYQ